MTWCRASDACHGPDSFLSRREMKNEIKRKRYLPQRFNSIIYDEVRSCFNEAVSRHRYDIDCWNARKEFLYLEFLWCCGPCTKTICLATIKTYVKYWRYMQLTYNNIFMYSIRVRKEHPMCLKLGLRRNWLPRFKIYN